MNDINDTNLQPYIIGETAYNHEGDFNYLVKMVDEIAELRLNAVKFHLLLNPESYMQKKHPLIKKLKTWMFSNEQWDEIIKKSTKRKLDVVALCDDVESIEYILNCERVVNSIEIHSVSLNDHFILENAAKFEGRIILGIGGSTLDEIDYAIQFLRNKGVKDILLMYGFQSYPTNYKEINLSKMIKLKSLFNCPVGYADHTSYNDPNNTLVSSMGAVMGFNILEKHFTLDFGQERIDYHAAIGKEHMEKIKQVMQLALDIYGRPSLEMSAAEKNYGNIGPMKKAIVAKTNIKKGDLLSFDNLWFKRTQEESYIKQNQFLSLIGLKTNNDIIKDDIIDFSKIKYEFRDYNEEDFTNVGKR